MKKKSTKQKRPTEQKKVLDSHEAPKSLSAIINGDVTISPFSSDTLEGYEKQLNRKNLIELQQHAASLGIKASHDRASLKKALLNNFSRVNSSLETSFSKVVTKEDNDLLSIMGYVSFDHQDENEEQTELSKIINS